MGETFYIICDSKIRCILHVIWWIKQIDCFFHADSDSIIFGLTTNLLYSFDIFRVSTAVVLVKIDVFLLVPTGKVLEVGFFKFFFS